MLDFRERYFTFMALPASLDPQKLADCVDGFAHWFRYPLHATDFHAIRGTGDEALLGYYAAKPLYGTCGAHGRIDRGAGFNGQVMALFVPSPARSWRHARLVRARMPRDRVRLANGRRNWPAIRHAAESAIRRLGKA